LLLVEPLDILLTVKCLSPRSRTENPWSRSLTEED
jgi:hypothetical protein